jgi:lipopolysaccharide transport system ATP-binding protein
MGDNSEVLVKVDGISKKFCRDLKRSLWYGVKDIASEIVGGGNSHQTLRRDEFWAVQDVSFELKRGECLGLIGHNGAGKSTLLKMLNGLIKPDTGMITMKGRVGALIELGAGFNPILTGRENVYINGQILGFTRKEIDQKLDDIIEFAEIREFIDMPVQNYSSGMKVRLGFAVAAQMEPDVLIIDEVLAVGDTGFQVKCFNQITKIMRQCAVIMVSHQMVNIGRLSSKVLLMDKGTIELSTDKVSEAIEQYYSKFKLEDKSIISSVIKFKGLFVGDKTQNRNIRFGDPVWINLQIDSSIEIEQASVGIAIYDLSLQCVGSFREYLGKISRGDQSIRIKIDAIMLAGTRYYFSIEINRFDGAIKREIYAHFRNIDFFTVYDHPKQIDAVVLLNGNVQVQ